MENASDALIMAGSVLLFVLALSLAILSFSNARQAMDTVLSFSDRESISISNDDRFYYLASTGNVGVNNSKSRYVGKETIIPAMYRAYKENYKIIFNFNDGESYYLFKNNNTENINTLDLSANNGMSGIGSDSQSKQFLKGLIYHKYPDFGDDKTTFETTFGVKLPTKSLYEKITEIEGTNKIKEELGTYYMEDLKSNPEDTSEKSDVEDINKTEKRVITYTVE